MMTDSEWVERMARLRRINQRGGLTYAILEAPLPSGVTAIVRLGQPGAPSRYAIVSREGFDDEVVHLARLTAHWYEMLHEDDDSPVEITRYADGHTAAVSRRVL